MDDEFREYYLNTFNDKISKLMALKSAAIENEWDERSNADLTQYIHQLSGSSGSYGFNDVFTSATNIEAKLKQFQSEPIKSDAIDKLTADIDDLLRRLKSYLI